VLGIIRTASICRKPEEEAAVGELMVDILKDIDAIVHIKDSNRKERDWFNHMSMLSDGSPAVGWVQVVSLDLLAGRRAALRS
jgi:adenylyl cyclase-associated protein